MRARFDHLVVAVDDLDEAAARWTTAGLPAVRGGAHPVGTVNALVRGPGPAYVELIAAGSADSNPWLDRVRSARGPISWAIAVDDVDDARAALVGAGFTPGEVREGSRTTPDGEVVAWRMCDVGPGPYDGSLPFLIEWTSPMGPGPADGPVLRWFELAPPDPDRLADLLLALGFEGRRFWPRRSFKTAGGVGITVHPLAEAAEQDPDQPVAAVVLALAGGELTRHRLDGVVVTTHPDRRRFAASALQPSRGSGSARERADAWVRAVVEAGLATVEDVDVEWAEGVAVEVTGAIRLHGPAGTQPVTVVRGVHPLDRHVVVVIGVGDPVEVIERQPAIGGAPVAEQVDRIDDAFVLALSGGVYAVRGRRRSVTRHPDGMASDGRFADGEAEQWLEQAATGRRTDGVTAGEPWL
ncbi:hypothetical protein GCM10011376_21470 [Nocardioides flavus (ex Wang et al. 2016)]|uniref:VOC domain-containing protein n=1 Tax=Nocardioides flavus (ex Wang et al. 2016) TaxID=2058780 RepID=A0ABQ3HM94_9ACTN|nr:VOC family protein [Nocardioides flavus (ex Wang et al. 2016)]GHE17537.1 hypothetical protein GCM10011376_21470 [Nocardioides flavus (ex Wang et al. 2016)]